MIKKFKKQVFTLKIFLQPNFFGKIFFYLILLVFPFGQLARINLANFVPGLKIQVLDIGIFFFVLNRFLAYRPAPVCLQDEKRQNFLFQKKGCRFAGKAAFLASFIIACARFPKRQGRARYSEVRNKKIVTPNFFKKFLIFCVIATISLLVKVQNLSFEEFLVSFFYLLRLINYSFFYLALLDFFQREKIKILDIFIGEGIAISFLALFQYIVLPDTRFLYNFGWDKHYYRAIGSFLDPAFTGILLIFSLNLFLYKFLQQKKLKFFEFFGFLENLAALVLTFSRLSYLLFFLSLFLFFISSLRIPRQSFGGDEVGKKKAPRQKASSFFSKQEETPPFSASSADRRGLGGFIISKVKECAFSKGSNAKDAKTRLFFLKKIKKNFLISFFILLIFGIFLFLSPKPGGEGVNLLRISSFIARKSSYKEALTIIKDNLWLGVGYNNYRVAQKKYGFVDNLGFRFSNAAAGTDNSFLFTWATTGVFGLFFYLWFWFAAIKTSYKLLSSSNLASILFNYLVCLLVSSFVVNSLFYPWIVCWIFCFLAAFTADNLKSIQPQSCSKQGQDK